MVLMSPIDRSPSLTSLTPELVLEALALGDNLVESELAHAPRGLGREDYPAPPAVP